MLCSQSAVKTNGSHPACVCVYTPSRLLIYGEYCSHMEHAQNTLNQLLASREDFRQKVEVTGPSPAISKVAAP